MSDAEMRLAEELNTVDIEKERAKFEAFALRSPYNCNLERWPNDPARYAWPGHYVHLGVQLAWDAWMEAASRPRVEYGQGEKA